ncbi:MAG: nitroreductase family deazaflavin-dependent oxidoreductase [Candidatus Hodarchaeales archaeon]|jgi:deazaflavin-dependent oxidoreductase (nitroreductase family)
MVDFRNLPKPIWRVLKFPRLLFKLGIRPSFVLLLTTIGRKTGKQRVTPLQYEEENGIYYVGSARGRKADWYRNIVENSNVTIQIKSQIFDGQALTINDTHKIADFLELRLRNHPRMVGRMLKAEGLSANPTRAELERFAANVVLVAIERNEST